MNPPAHRRGKRRTPKIAQQQVQMVWEAFHDALREPLLRGLWYHLCHELAKEFGVPYSLEPRLLETLSDLQARQPLTNWKTVELMAELMHQWGLPVAQALEPNLTTWILGAAMTEVTETWPQDLQISLFHLLPDNPLSICRQNPNTLHGHETARREHFDQLMEAIRAQRGEDPFQGRPPGSYGMTDQKLHDEMYDARAKLVTKRDPITQENLLRKIGPHGDTRRVREWCKRLGITWDQFRQP